MPFWFICSYAQKGISVSDKEDSTNIVVLDTSEFFLDDAGEPDDIVIGSRDVHTHTGQKDVYTWAEHVTEQHHSEDTTKPHVYGHLDSIANPKVRALLLDSLFWMSIDTNFRIFDSMAVNPYKYKAEKYKDTVEYVLYDSLSNEEGSRWWAMPLATSHEITSHFGQRWSRWHYGTDLRLAIGDSVFACFDGVVRICKYNRGGYGNYIMLRHWNGTETLYGHLTKQLVGVGDTVKAGQLIGWGGNTGRSSGPHLHFELRIHGSAINTEDVFDYANDTIRGPIYTLDMKSYEYIRKMKARIYYRVRSGDSLYRIARRYRVSIGQICRLNGIRRTTILRIGRRLRIR